MGILPVTIMLQIKKTRTGWTAIVRVTFFS